MSSRSKRRKLILNTYLELLALVIFLALFVRFTVMAPYKIPSEAMAPTLVVGDFVLAYTLPFGIRLPFVQSKIGMAQLPERGDILLFKYQLDRQSLFIKRVYGLPGDTVEIKQGQLWVNDKQAVAVPSDISMPPLLIPSNSVFLVGDNPRVSDDLQYWSLVSKEQVLGRINWIWFSADQLTNGIRWGRLFTYVH